MCWRCSNPDTNRAEENIFLSEVSSVALGVGKPSYLERCPPAIEESPTTISLSFPSLSQKLEMIKINSQTQQPGYSCFGQGSEVHKDHWKRCTSPTQSSTLALYQIICPVDTPSDFRSASTLQVVATPIVFSEKFNILYNVCVCAFSDGSTL